MVKDTGEKGQKIRRPQHDSKDTPVGDVSPKKKRSKVQRETKPVTEEDEVVDERATRLSFGGNGRRSRSASVPSVDVLHGFRLGQSAANPAGADDVMPPYGSSAPMESPQSKSMKLHGRPLELVCAMIGVAYAKLAVAVRIVMCPSGQDGRSRTETHVEGRVSCWVSTHNRFVAEASCRVSKMQTFHPWLDTLDAIFLEFTRAPNGSSKVLLAVVLYLSSLAKPHDSALANFRTSLVPLIIHLRDRTVLRLPRTCQSVQALELLALHAPFGILPLQLTDTRSPDIARGQIAAASVIASSLEWSSTFGDPESHHLSTTHDQDSPALWTWLALCADEAALALENETPLRPSFLDAATLLSRRFLQQEYVESWSKRPSEISVAQIIGRISVCDRITRLAVVHDGLAEILAGLNRSAVDRNFDLIGATVATIQQTLNSVEEMGRTHGMLMSA